jgi:membrane protease YdiL (CAAX protease family)
MQMRGHLVQGRGVMTAAANPVRPTRGLAIFDYVLFRAVINLIVLFGAYIGLQIGVRTIMYRLPPAEHDLALLIGFAVLAALMFVFYGILVRLLERRRAEELAFAPSIALGGVVLGAFLFCAVYIALWSLGIAHSNGIARDTKILVPLAIALGAAFGEELTFRGGVFRVLEDGFGTAVALIASAVAFGLIHALNPGATVVSTAAIALESGVLLGLAYAATRSLWLPIGLHFGWNFTEGGIFGASVSGRAYHGVFDFSVTGPDILTGGAFGPEASVVAVAISLAASFALAVIAVRNGRWKPLSARWRA